MFIKVQPIVWKITHNYNYIDESIKGGKPREGYLTCFKENGGDQEIVWFMNHIKNLSNHSTNCVVTKFQHTYLDLFWALIILFSQ